ncbi:MAG: aminopeptidase N [Bowdeniella nasicola]|nr:aminopeptidase N [Bowdeniella nasicola]
MPGTNLTRTEAAERAAVITKVHGYDIAVDVTGSDKTFTSHTTITFAAQPGKDTFVDLIAPAVKRIVLNGNDIDVAAFANSRIALPALAAENELVVEAVCAFTNTGEGMHRFVDPVDGEAYLYTQFEVPDARRVFACFEQPDLKAPFTFHVTAPAHWQVVSNEPAHTVSDRNGHAKQWDFLPTAPISTYITAIVAGPYHAVHDQVTSSDGRQIPLGVYCRASLAEHLDAESVFTTTRQGFGFFEEHFGRAYPFTKYDQLFVPEYNAGAMENAGCVTIRDEYVFVSKPTEAMVERLAETILHELAHMWFGDLVTMKWWDDLWLNESFAEYMAILSSAEATRWSQAWTTFAMDAKAWAYTQDQLPSTHPIVADIPDLAAVEVNFDGITYAKGAAVLRSLVAYVGREAFFAGVKQYFADHAWSNTTLPDFLTALEKTSKRDLSRWAKVWLQEAGLTIIRPDIDRNHDGVVTRAQLTQTSYRGSSLRPHRITVGCYERIEGTYQRSWGTELDLDGRCAHLDGLVGQHLGEDAIVLVNDHDLAYAKIRMSPREVELFISHADLFVDSLPLAVGLTMAWDMVRDAEMSAADFLTLVGNALKAPAMEPAVRATVLRQAVRAANVYSPPAHRDQIRADFCATLKTLLHAADGGSDAQLLYLRAFAQLATTPDQLALLDGIYRGEVSLAGLRRDNDLRWHLLSELLAAGLADSNDLAAQCERDRSLSGGHKAARARAAIATRQARVIAFQTALTDTSLSNDALLATMEGMWIRADRHPEWFADMCERYLQALPSVWRERSTAIAQALVLGLFSHRLVGLAPIVEQVSAWLETADIPAALRRLVSEELDEATRALAVQQV